MKRLQPHELSTLRHVHHHRRVCLGEITSQADALMAETMRKLAKRKLLIEAVYDDGPTYSIAPAAILILEQLNG